MVVLSMIQEIDPIVGTSRLWRNMVQGRRSHAVFLYADRYLLIAAGTISGGNNALIPELYDVTNPSAPPVLYTTYPISLQFATGST